MPELTSEVLQAAKLDSTNYPALVIDFLKSTDGTIIGSMVPESIYPDSSIVGLLSEQTKRIMQPDVLYRLSFRYMHPSRIDIGDLTWYDATHCSRPEGRRIYSEVYGFVSEIYPHLVRMLSIIPEDDDAKELIAQASQEHLEECLKRGGFHLMKPGMRTIRFVDPTCLFSGLDMMTIEYEEFSIPARQERIIAENNMIVLRAPVSIHHPFYPTMMTLLNKLFQEVLEQVEADQIKRIEAKIALELGQRLGQKANLQWVVNHGAGNYA